MRNYLRRMYGSYIQRATTEVSQDDLRRSAVVLAPHQDDETLGCGGTVIKKKEAGAEVRIVFMTDGTQSHSHLMSPGELKKTRKNEAIAACQALGLAESDVLFLEFKDGRLYDSQDEAVREVIDILRSYDPDEIFIPYQGDRPIEHVATHRIAMSALERWGKQVIIYEYLIWAWNHWPWVGMFQNSRRATLDIFKNTFFSIVGLCLLKDLRQAVYIGDVLDRKRRALDQHKSQMTRLIPDRRWQTLGDVSNGEFLVRFFQEYEYFRFYKFPKNDKMPSRTRTRVH